MRTEGKFQSRLKFWFSSSPEVRRKTGTHTQTSQQTQATRVFLPSDGRTVCAEN